MKERISAKGKLALIVLGVVLTPIFFGLADNSKILLLAFMLVLAMDAVAEGCIVAAIIHIFTRRLSDWSIITVFCGIQSLLWGIPGERNLFFEGGDVYLGIWEMIMAISVLFATVVMGICWIIYRKKLAEW